MKCFVGIGSNLGNRHVNIRRALEALSRSAGELRCSPIYETEALVLADAPDDWRRPFLNAVVELAWTAGAEDLLSCLKKIESELGRVLSSKWAPRIIDLDLLLFGDEKVATEKLSVPHPEMKSRAFVYDPLKDLAPQVVVSGVNSPAVVHARTLNGHRPLIMTSLELESLAEDSDWSAHGQILELRFKNSMRNGENTTKLKQLRDMQAADYFIPRIAIDSQDRTRIEAVADSGLEFDVIVQGINRVDSEIADLRRQGFMPRLIIVDLLSAKTMPLGHHDLIPFHVLGSDVVRGRRG